MDGYRAYKYYASIKLHFTTDNYDVFKMKGRINYPADRFTARNDRYLFEKIGSKFSSDKQFVEYIASNFMYGNPNVIYDSNVGVANYREYIRRKESISKVFADDLHTLALSFERESTGRQKIPAPVKLWLAGMITIETVVILNKIDNFLHNQRNDHLSLVLGDDLRRLAKSAGFVKYNEQKILHIYHSYKEELQGNQNGQDVSQSFVAV